ncbi:MAG: amidohydrolase family protein, partial [Chloroflexi bacterium]|nr:amidohydrolase family protein [Chloroflexota bacterium]
SRPFEAWMGDIMAREDRPATPQEIAACALVTGLENLSAGNTALVDQYFGTQTKEHVHALAGAYEALGLRAWVFVTVSDLPYLCFTKESFPRYPGAIPLAELPDEIQPLMLTTRYEDQLSAVADIIRGWQGSRVKIGLALSNPVWCSDDLLRDAAQLARELDSPVVIHAEESPTQREVALSQWGMSGIRRLAEFGLLSPRTLLPHVVQIDDADIRLLAEHGVSISHNPISNLKLQTGIAPIGRMIAAGVNVCLGSDGQGSGDSQSLFSVLKFVAALAGLNGLRDLEGVVEEIALPLAIENGRRLWFEGDLSRDSIEFSQPLGPYAYAWDDPVPHIAEVYVDGVPRLGDARRLVREKGADRIVNELRAQAANPERAARAERFAAIGARQARSR